YGIPGFVLCSTRSPKMGQVITAINKKAINLYLQNAQEEIDPDTNMAVVKDPLLYEDFIEHVLGTRGFLEKRIKEEGQKAKIFRIIGAPINAVRWYIGKGTLNARAIIQIAKIVFPECEHLIEDIYVYVINHGRVDG
ncbi:MAG: hypothetical protein AAB540_01715, partial [Patescibacteria group bacterium]